MATGGPLPPVTTEAESAATETVASGGARPRTQVGGIQVGGIQDDAVFKQKLKHMGKCELIYNLKEGIQKGHVI